MNTKTTMLQGGVTAVMVLTMAVSVFSPAAAATFSSTIDFEGLAEGMIVSSVAIGAGISGDDAGGSVGVIGFNPKLAGNTALIFDAECLPGGVPADCTGGDSDLFHPGHGNVLIIANDLVDMLPADDLVDDPDDADVKGAYWEFDFSVWGPGVVTIDQLTILDIEDDEVGGIVEVFLGGISQGTVPLPETGDGGLADVAIGLTGDFLKITLGGSAAVDNIEITVGEEDGAQGCTPGFWRQPQHFDSWVGYSPSDSYDTTFGVISSFGGTLLEALERGGGGEAALGRHAVAALLNAASPDVDYFYSEAEVIALVQAADSSGEFEDAKDALELQNELGCGLD